MQNAQDGEDYPSELRRAQVKLISHVLPLQGMLEGEVGCCWLYLVIALHSQCTMCERTDSWLTCSCSSINSSQNMLMTRNPAVAKDLQSVSE